MGGSEKATTHSYRHTEPLQASLLQGFDQAGAQKPGCMQAVTAVGVGVGLTLVPE